LRSLACFRIGEKYGLDRGGRAASANRAEDRSVQRIESLRLELKVDLLSHLEPFLKTKRCLRRIWVADDALPGIGYEWNPRVAGKIREAVRAFVINPFVVRAVSWDKAIVVLRTIETDAVG